MSTLHETQRTMSSDATLRNDDHDDDQSLATSNDFSLIDAESQIPKLPINANGRQQKERLPNEDNSISIDEWIKKSISPSKKEVYQSTSQHSKEPSIIDDITTDLDECESEMVSFERPEFALLAYARSNNLEKLNRLLANNPSIEINFKGTQKQNWSWTALHLSSYFGHAAFVDRLLEFRGINIDVQNNVGDTPLHKAALTNRMSIVQKLLAKGANVFILNLSGYVAKQLTNNSHILNMISATEKVDDRKRQELIEASGQSVLSRISLTRFEGPLLRKVRMFGPNQTYVVLENGALLLFRTHKDYLNRSLRAYKYLEGANCQADSSDACFTINFSDNSKVTFQINQKDVEFYNVYTPNQVLKSQEAEQRKSSVVLELIRLKWIHAINDHIRYCAQFTTDGKRHEYKADDRTYTTVEGLIHLNSVQSTLQEASAHFNILSKHADSLRNLVEKNNSLSKVVNQTSIISSIQQQEIDKKLHNQSTATTSAEQDDQSSVGSRILNLFAGRQVVKTQTPTSVNETLHESTTGNQSEISTSATDTKQLSEQTNMHDYADFLQSWPCILFHLKLLLESSQHTKESMNQALILLENQEKIRTDRLKQLAERCQILEESLHSINHHELEKSRSMSQVHLASSMHLSASMSTDLNLYHDAFEDFDDVRTLTPDSSHHDDNEDYKGNDVDDFMVKRSQEVEKVNNLHTKHDDVQSKQISPSRSEVINPSYPTNQPNNNIISDLKATEHQNSNGGYQSDDNESNCSALTVGHASDDF